MDTPQERFWAGEFGKDYADRNNGADLLASKTAMFAKIIARTQGVRSVRELGANIGLNIKALQTLLPGAAFQAIEINPYAHGRLASLPNLRAFHGSLLEPLEAETVDLAFTAGVLIHIAPDRLPDAYTRLHEASRRYVLVIEYFNPEPVALPYRGHAERLYKRDFAGELLTRYPDLRLVDYGFFYRRDPGFPGDDETWFLMEKR